MPPEHDFNVLLSAPAVILENATNRALNRLRSQGYKIGWGPQKNGWYEGYIGYIFTKEEDLREMTKYKNLAELFEKATDSAKHVADCVRIMLLGYSNN